MERGRLVSLREPGRPVESRIAARLSRLGVIEDATLGWALGRSAGSGRSLLEVLRDECGVSELWVERVRRWERADAWLVTFTRDRGAYYVRPDPETWAETDAVRPPPTVDQMILAGLELGAAWPSVRRWVPSWALAVERRSPAAPRPADAPPHVARLQTHLWRLARPGMSAAELAALAPAPRVYARWALAELVARGALTWAAAGAETGAAALSREGRRTPSARSTGR